MVVGPSSQSGETCREALITWGETARPAGGDSAAHGGGCDQVGMQSPLSYPQLGQALSCEALSHTRLKRPGTPPNKLVRFAQAQLGVVSLTRLDFKQGPHPSWARLGFNERGIGPPPEPGASRIIRQASRRKKMTEEELTLLLEKLVERLGARLDEQYDRYDKDTGLIEKLEYVRTVLLVLC